MVDLNQQVICEKIKDFLVIRNSKPNEDVKINTTSSYSCVDFFDNSAFRVKCGKNKNYISTKTSFQSLSKYKSIPLEYIKSDPLWVRIPITSVSDIEDLFPLILDLYDESYQQISTETFSCCSRYVECSDALKCIHPDKLLAKGCKYKNNLQNERIFYGKNANVKYL